MGKYGWHKWTLCGGLLIGLVQLAYAQQPTTPPDTLAKPAAAIVQDTTGLPKAVTPATTEEAKEQNKADFPLDNFYAERKKWPLSFLRHFRFSLSTGLGRTFFSHELPGYGIYQAPGGAPQIFPGTSTTTRYSNWINERILDNTAADPAAFLVPAGTASVGFRGSAINIPLKLTVHFEFKQRYRIGLGYSFEYMGIGEFSPTAFEDQLGTMQPTNNTGMMSRFFGMAGVSFYRAGPYLFTGDIQVGSFSPSNFDASLATTGVYFNGGVTIERDLSEYLRVFVRPSYEFKSYTLNLPEGGNAIDHGMNALYLNVGLTYRIPELPKCFHKDCRSQLNHAHGDREYRSRVHPIYKKQNPNYGENHPNLIKYKGKNKKKLNPY
jgi:hypothetical protein